MIERLVDDAARQLGIDRVALRRRNLIRRFPHRTPLGYIYDSGDYERCLDLALSLGRVDVVSTADPDRVTGTGVALLVERAGGAWESAEVEVAPDGRVIVRSSSSPHGQGHDTTFSQIASSRLGVPASQIEFRFGDSAEVPRGVGTFGSRSVAVGGSAVVVAIDNLVQSGRSMAAAVLGVAVDEVEFSRRVPLAPAGGRCRWLSSQRPSAIAAGGARSASSHPSLCSPRGRTRPSSRSNARPGRLHVLRVAAVDDAGTVINPLLSHGQVIGGAVQGLGECLVEEAVYDDSGQALSASLMSYSLLTAADVPPIVCGEVSSPSPMNPLGAKGVGEGGAIGALAAISNAVVDALGGRHVDPPFSDEKLWRALR